MVHPGDASGATGVLTRVASASPALSWCRHWGGHAHSSRGFFHHCVALASERYALGSPRAAGSRVEPSPVCADGKDWHHEGTGRWPLGHGGRACGGKRPGTGGTMVQGPGCAAWHGRGALGLDALPMTRGTSPTGHSPRLLFTTRI